MQWFSHQHLDWDSVFGCWAQWPERAPINTQVKWNHRLTELNLVTQRHIYWPCSRACLGIACPFNSLKFCHLPVPIWRQFMNWDGVYLSHEVTACLHITLSPSPSFYMPLWSPLLSLHWAAVHCDRPYSAVHYSDSTSLYCKGFYFCRKKSGFIKNLIAWAGLWGSVILSYFIMMHLLFTNILLGINQVYVIRTF